MHRGLSRPIGRALLAALLLSAGSTAAQEEQQRPAAPTPSRNAKPDGEAADGRIPIPNVRTYHFAGQLVMEDGSPLPPDLRVELFCHGRILKQVSVDTQGGFTMEMGGTFEGDWFDSSAPGNATTPTGGLWTRSSTIAQSPTALRGCELRLSPVAGYAAVAVNLSGVDLLAEASVGTLVVRRLGTNAGDTAVSLTTLQAPEKARQAWRKARRELSRERPDWTRVIRETERAVREYPAFTEAWYLLGLGRLRRDDPEGAREAFERAVQADDTHTASYFELARLEMNAGDWPAACRWTSRLIELEPARPEILYFDGMAHYYTERFERAETSLRKLLEADDASFPMTYFFLAMIDREQEQFDRAAEEFRRFLETAPAAEAPADLKRAIEQQLASWEQQGVIGN